MKAFDLASSESIKYFSKVNTNIYLVIILSIFLMFLSYFLLFS